MIRISIAFLLLTNFFATSAAAEKQPEFVKNKMKFYSKNKPTGALSRPLGWGRGTYNAEKGRKVEFIWFAYSNSNGWVQFDLDTRLRVDDTLKIESIVDSYERPWETILGGNTTWIGATNDWIENNNCRFKKSDILTCDFKKGLKSTVNKINEKPFIKFKIRGYLNWPKKVAEANPHTTPPTRDPANRSLFFYQKQKRTRD